MRKLFIFLMIGIFLLSFTYAQQQSLGTFKQNECIELKQGCASCSYVNFTRVLYPDSTTALGNVEATKDGSVFNYTFCNTSQLGTYVVYGIGDVDSTDTVFAYDFEITPSGENLNLQKTIIHVSLLLFFIFLGIGFYILSSRVDLEKWNNSIFKKYENKNYVKLVLSSICYNFLKNTFIIYYLIGIPILLTLVDLSFSYGLINLVEIFRALLIIYLVGILIVGLIFLSHVQEWFMDLLEKISDNQWGVNTR